MSTTHPEGIEASEPSRFERFVDARFWNSRIVTGLVTLFALVMLYFVFTVPLAFYEQLTFATSCFVLRRMKGWIVARRRWAAL